MFLQPCLNIPRISLMELKTRKVILQYCHQSRFCCAFEAMLQFIYTGHIDSVKLLLDRLFVVDKVGITNLLLLIYLSITKNQFSTFWMKKIFVKIGFV